MPNESQPDFAAAKTVDFEQIPVVDISDIHTKDGFGRIAQELVKTAEEIGFFYIKGHGIDPRQIENAFAASNGSLPFPQLTKARLR